jgi:hypothetical protein
VLVSDVPFALRMAAQLFPGGWRILRATSGTNNAHFSGYFEDAAGGLRGPQMVRGRGSFEDLLRQRANDGTR